MRIPTTALLLLAAGSFACFDPRPDASRYYTLSTEPPGPPASSSVPSLGIGPVTFPPYLDRSEVATRVGPDQLEYSNADRWAAPLRDLFVQALAEDLRGRAPAAQVVTWPWPIAIVPELAVSIDVLRCEAEAGGAAEVYARFALRAGPGGPLLETGETRFREEIASIDFPKAAAALSRGVAALADDVAKAAARHSGR